MPLGDRIEAAGEYAEIKAGESRSVRQSTAEGVAVSVSAVNHTLYLLHADLHAAGLGEYRKLSGTSCLFIHRSIFCGSTWLPRTSKMSWGLSVSISFLL